MLLSFQELLVHVLTALGYYATVVFVTRVSGKRIAGQMATVDLLILIGMSVAAMEIAVRAGTAGSLVFIAVVLVTHRTVTHLANTYPRFRWLVRGGPRALVRDGVMLRKAMEDEEVSEEELLAGLRKLGYAEVQQVKLAILEETGSISAVPRDPEPRR